MKKLITLLCVLSFSIASFAQSGTCGDNLTWELSNGTLIISGTGEMDDYNYNSIPWYDNRESITKVIINDGVTSVGDGAFSGCSSLTSIDIPNSVTSIGESALGGCYSMTSLDISKNVIFIGRGAFEANSLNSIIVDSSNPIYDSRNNCNAIIETATNTLITGCSNTIIPNNVTSIGYKAFYYVINLVSIEIPNSVTRIGECAFYSCVRLKSIDIPNSVIYLDEGAFGYCDSLFTINIPNSVKNIGRYAFDNCKNLNKVTCYATTPPQIASDAFYGVETSTIPLYVPGESVELYKAAEVWREFDIRAIESIEPCVLDSGTCGADGDNLTWQLDCDGTLTIFGNGKMNNYGYPNYSPWYSYCESIAKVIISDGVTNIGNLAFFGCHSLTSIDIPNSVTSIGDDAFYDCRSLTSIELPNSVTSIGDYAFDYTTLQQIYIPASVINIGSCAFNVGTIRDCNIIGSLQSIDVDQENKYYSAQDGVLFNKAKTVLIAYPTARTEDYTIPSNVEIINSGAFFGANFDIKFSEGLKIIKSEAFSYCFFESVKIPNSVEHIGYYAFNGCTNIKELIIGNSIDSIGNSAFDLDMDKITSIKCYSELVPDIEIREKMNSIFLIKGYNCNDEDFTVDMNDYKEFTIYVPKESLDEYRNSPWGIYTIKPLEDDILSSTDYTITLDINNQTMGTTLGGGTFAVNSLVTFAAVPYKGCQFSQWSDGNTDNPRTITVAENKTYTAQFEVIQTTSEPKVYQVNIQGDNCSMNVSNQYPEGSVITIQVIPDECLEFKQWSDGNTDNPRTITVNKDNTYTVEFNKLQYIVTGKSNSQAGGKVNIIKH